MSAMTVSAKRASAGSHQTKARDHNGQRQEEEEELSGLLSVSLLPLQAACVTV